MAFPVLSTYRLQLRGECVHLRRRREAAGLPCRPRRLAPVPVPDPDRRPRVRRTATTSPTRPRCRPNSAAPTVWPRLSAAARARGMGLIVDIVPNHVGVDEPEQNPWWWDVLRTRPRSRPTPRTSTSTGTWSRRPDRVAGSGFRRRRRPTSTVDGDVLRLGDLAFPDRAGDRRGHAAREVHDRQHYRLIGWRNGVCGYRRFFSITSLAGLRQEDPRGVRRHPRRGRGAGSPRGSSTGCASTIRTDCPTRGLSARGCAN